MLPQRGKFNDAMPPRRRHFLRKSRIIVQPVESGARNGLVELLGRVPLFSELSPDELERVAQVAVPRTFPRDTRVFHEGDPGDACYIVSRGSCRVTRQHSDGRTITLATLGPGTIFGELAMFDGERRSASVEAAENTELLALPASDMKRLIREHSEMAEKLIVALTRRLREANERISRQSFQTVPSRVAGVLNQLAGTSRESVSRFLATLERAGVVQVGRGRVTVIEPERLDAYIF